jgi:hypothetical protein
VAQVGHFVISTEGRNLSSILSNLFLENPKPSFDLLLHADLAQESLVFECLYDAAIEKVIRVGFLGFRVLA